MALGKRRHEQQEAWVATSALPKSPGHPFYRTLNQLLAELDFDRWVERLCAPYYAQNVGRPSIPPGVYFRMILIGYFEGIGSQRGIAWRCSDSRSLQEFLGVAPTDETPDHSSMSRIHVRLPLEVHAEVFRLVLRIACEKKLLDGKTVGVDSTTLEANAAMKSIERKESGEDWMSYLKRLAEESGIQNPTEEDARRFDKGRKDKKVSNAEWESPTDPESRITKMKDGTTHLAYKAEHVVDLKTDLVLAATVHPGDASDAETLVDSVMEAQRNVGESGSDAEIHDVVADKGYHKASTLELADGLALRTYVPESDRPNGRRWTDKPAGYQAAVYGNRRRTKGARGKRLQRWRSEMLERSFAHVCETGGSRRCWLRGLERVTKRYLIQVAARNLGLIMRVVFGMGTPRGLQPEGDLLWFIYVAITHRWVTWGALSRGLACVIDSTPPVFGHRLAGRVAA
jgi:transposase